MRFFSTVCVMTTLLVAAACAGMMVCGPIALALGALLLSRHALRRRLA